MKHYVIVAVSSGIIFETWTYNEESLARKKYAEVIQDYQDPGKDYVGLTEFEDFGEYGSLLDSGPEEEEDDPLDP